VQIQRRLQGFACAPGSRSLSAFRGKRLTPGGVADSTSVFASLHVAQVLKALPSAIRAHAHSHASRVTVRFRTIIAVRAQHSSTLRTLTPLFSQTRSGIQFAGTITRSPAYQDSTRRKKAIHRQRQT
jgi:hypothetical protein